MVPMHHLKPLVGSEALEGKTVPPTAEICWIRSTELVRVDEGVSKIPPNARQWMVTGLPATPKPGIVQVGREGSDPWPRHGIAVQVIAEVLHDLKQ